MQVQLTPKLGTPAYSVLFKKDDYEVRRYERYNVAETSMGAGAGPAAGEGFTELAGYIFGGNEAEKKMDMTTPVFSTGGGGGGGGSRMQFVLDSGVEPGAFPAPKSRDVERRSEAGGLRAVASFSGLPTDGEVRLLSALRQQPVCASVKTNFFWPGVSVQVWSPWSRRHAAVARRWCGQRRRCALRSSGTAWSRGRGTCWRATTSLTCCRPCGATRS